MENKINKTVAFSSKDTLDEYNIIIDECSDIFNKKTKDYGTAWRILRNTSLTDQIFIKANRIRSIETGGINRVGDSIREEFIGIVNYSIVGLIQLKLGYLDILCDESDKILHLYVMYLTKARDLMMMKNHDYGEAWRSMRISSYTDLILMKIMRIKQIENNNGNTIISEGIDANYYDMINYSIFGLIRLEEEGI